MFDFLYDGRVIGFMIVIALAIFVAVILTVTEKPRRSSNYWSSYETKTFNMNFFEILAVIVLTCLLSAGVYSWGISSRQVGKIPEQIGGFITEKTYVDGSHEVSHENCTGSGDDRHCTTWYETVYHRTFILKNSTGDWWDGNQWSQRVDKCGGEAGQPCWIPQEWDFAYVGMPVSLDHQYKDYRTAVHEKEYKYTYDTLIEQGLKDICPEQPYVKVNMFQTIRTVYSTNFDKGVADMITASWNVAPRFEGQHDNLTSTDVPLYLDTIFGFSGSHYQNDTSLVFMNTGDTRYAQLCMAKWNRGVKNALYLFVFGAMENGQFYPTDAIVEVSIPGETVNSEFAKNPTANIKSNAVLKMVMEQDLDKSFAGNPLNKDAFLRIVVDDTEKYWNREEMSNFKKDADLITPTDGWIGFWFTVIDIVMVLLTIFFLFADITELE